MPFFIIELIVWAGRTSRLDRSIKPALERFGPETHSQGGGWLSDQAKPYWTPSSRDTLSFAASLC